MVPTLDAAEPAIRPNGAQQRVSALSAHYNALWERIQDADLAALPSIAIGVMSCAPHAGVSTVAFNIAVTAASNESGPVLYVDADVSKVSECGAIRVAPSLGLADVLDGAAAPLECTVATQCEELFVLSGRGTSSRARSPVDCSGFSDFLGEYKSRFRFVIVDIPAPSELNSSIRIASETDGVVLVIEAEQADARVAQRAKQNLIEANANILGVVLNKRRQYVPKWLYQLL